MASQHLRTGTKRSMRLQQAHLGGAEVWCEAVWQYRAEYEGDLHIQVGDVVLVTNTKVDDGWWEGVNTRTGKRGIFPINHVRECLAPGSTEPAKAPKGGAVIGPPPRGAEGILAVGVEASAVQVVVAQPEHKIVEAKRPAGGGSGGGGGKSSGGGGGGGKSKSKAARPKGGNNSRTRFGIWSSNLAIYGGMLWFLTGLCVLAWGSSGRAPWLHQCASAEDSCRDIFWNNGSQCPTAATDDLCAAPYGGLQVIAGLYGMVAGISIMLFEQYRGFPRDGGLPFRSITYAVVAVPGFITLPTLLAVLFIYLAAFVNAYAALALGEIYAPRRGPTEPRICGHCLITFKWGKYGSTCDRFLICLGGQNPEGRCGRIFFSAFYFMFNLIFGIVWFTDAQSAADAARAKHPEGALTGWTVWVPVAKFFGVIMDINFTVIFIPVSRLFIRSLYDASTSSQTNFSKTFRAILSLCPLDSALEFHMFCGMLGYASAVLHTAAHVLNFSYCAEGVWATFGWWIWFTGIGLLFFLTLLITAVHRNVRRNHFNIFYITHLGYVPITILNFFHGKGYFGPNFWKFAIIPMMIFVSERVYRWYISSKPVALVNFTNMGNVVSISLSKDAFSEYREGHFAFLACPHVSSWQWHPFTISSAPEEDTISFHMRIQGQGSWTRGVSEYLKAFVPSGAAFVELERHDKTRGKVKGKFKGPDGLPLFRIYGPCSAPTQHITEYSEVMICASGIGVTPLAACMKSIVFHKWKFFSGQCFPDRAHFFWVCSHRDVSSFRWFIRTIKEAEDAVVDLIQKNPQSVGSKMFHIHIFVTSFKQANVDLTPPAGGADDVAFWGRRRDVDSKAEGVGTDYGQVVRYGASFSEWDLYKAIMDPGENKTISMGHVHVHMGRPKWDEYFQIIQQRSPSSEIGVTFCGNPRVGADLARCCAEYTAKSGGEKIFRLHQEVF